MDRNLNILFDLDGSEISTSTQCNMSDLHKHVKFSKNNFKVLSQNVRSIYKNFDDLMVNLQQLPFEADIIVLSECWLDPKKVIPEIDN
jgi:hypothetical protein